MRIYIYYDITEEPWGGINSFFKAFRDYVREKKRKETTFATTLQDQYEILLFGGNYCGPGQRIKYEKIKKISEKRHKSRLGKLFGKQTRNYKIVHRVDGLRSKYTDNDSFCQDDKEQYRLLLLSDWIVFQTKDGLDCFKRIGYSRDNYTIIPNGVNQRIFNCKKRAWWNGKTKLKVLSTSWSANRKKGFDIISLVSRLEDVESIFVGNWHQKVDPGNVKIFHPVKQEELAAYYKECDVLLFPSQNEACPNVILEALSCGLPVIYHNSGGTPEIAHKYGVPLPEITSEESLQEVLEKTKVNYRPLVNRIKRDMKLFSIDYVAEQYLKMFEEVLSGKC